MLQIDRHNIQNVHTAVETPNKGFNKAKTFAKKIKFDEPNLPNLHISEYTICTSLKCGGWEGFS